jgi:antitoxin (DNA-binding transcriptional repressor) of toxin-antitoxin stability system
MILALGRLPARVDWLPDDSRPGRAVSADADGRRARELELADVGPEDLGGRQSDHGLCPWYDRSMDEIAVSKFKAMCLAALERVRRTRRPLRVTRFGKPLADIVPPASPPVSASWLGSMRYRGRIVGDIGAPVEPEEAWGADE